MSKDRILLGHAAFSRPCGPGRFGAVLGRGGGHCCEAETSPVRALRRPQIPALEEQKGASQRVQAGGGGVRRGDRLPSHKRIKTHQNMKQLLQSSFYMAAEGPELPRRQASPPGARHRARVQSDHLH